MRLAAQYGLSGYRIYKTSQNCSLAAPLDVSTARRMLIFQNPTAEKHGLMLSRWPVWLAITCFAGIGVSVVGPNRNVRTLGVHFICHVQTARHHLLLHLGDHHADCFPSQ